MLLTVPRLLGKTTERRELGSAVPEPRQPAWCVRAPSLLRALSSQIAFLPQSEPKLILFPGHDPSVSPNGIQPFNH